MAGYFPGLSLGETLEQFLDRMVRPDTRYLVSCREVIDTVVRLIHKHPSYNIKEVIKGGSLGKGTGVRAHSDVDLLVVVNDFRNVDDLRKNMPKILSSFRDYLLATVNTETGIRIQITKPPTPFTLQFKVCCAEDRDWFEVDLLPVIDVIDPSNVRKSLQVLYDRMEEEDYNRDYYAKCVARQQVEFVKFVPARVKDLIRLIKYWNYNEDVGLSSFCIELLVIQIWKQKGSPNNFKLTPMINDVSEMITSFDETTITFDNYYSPDYYVAMNKLKPPYILDPANPFHDAAPHKRVKENYSRIQERGRSLIRESVEAQAQMGSRFFGDVAYSSGSDEYYHIKSKSGKLLQLARDIKEKEYVGAVSNVNCPDLSPSSDEDDDNYSRSIKTATTGKRSGLWTALGVGAVLTGGLLAGLASASTMTFFKGMHPGETLEKFLDREVRPDTKFLSDCSQVIDTVVRLIHHNPTYKVNQVIKGGSLGKGTAVREHSDVDLLVVLNNFRDVEHLAENMEQVLSNFREYLTTAVAKTSNIAISMKGQTPFTLQFDLCCGNEWFDVDLLPIVDVWSTWFLGLAGGVGSTYSTMESKPHLRKYYAKSLAKLQVEFVKPIPARVKDLIRLLKYWKYTERVDLTSYCIELMVIYVWRENGKQNNFTMKQMMTKVVDLLASFNNVRITFNDHFTPSYYINQLNKKPPYVMDPANPYHDVASDPKWSFSTMSRDFHRIESEGRQLQRKLQGLPEESSCVIS